MSLLQFLYTYPSDEWSQALTPTAVAGTVDPDFPLANFATGNPAISVQFTTTFVTLQWDRGAAGSFGLMGIIHGNLTGSAEIQCSNDPTFATGVQTFPFTLNPADQEGYYDGCWLDLSSNGLNATAARYVRLVITGNAANVILGALSFNAATRILAHNPAWGYLSGAMRPRVPTLYTIVGVALVTQSYGRRRYWGGSIDSVPDVDRNAIDSWQQASGGEDQPFLIVVDSTINSVWLVRWQTGLSASATTQKHEDFNFTGQMLDVNTSPVGWMEVARGRPWGSV